MLKRAALCLFVALFALPAWAARQLTVAELSSLLRSMHQDNKSDEEIAAALKQVQLTEELTHNTANSLAPYLPGTQSTEQIYVLEARSAVLAPPASDLPATPAPAAGAVKAVLDKAAAYINNVSAQVPVMTATRTTQRFQDQVEPEPPGTRADAPSGPNTVSFRQFVHYIQSTDTPVTIERGLEKMATEKDKTPWGANRMIVIQEQPDLSLSTVLSSAQAAGTLKWLRWETVNGRQTAVFSFDVPKKRSRFTFSVCCFPSQTGANAQLFTAALPNVSGADRVNQQAAMEWRDYHVNAAPYRGEFFIDPQDGSVIRMIIQPELKASDLVRTADMRIDYGPVTLASRTVMVPVKSVVATVVMPYGAQAGKSSERCTFFVSEYKDYRIADGATAQK